MFAERNGEILKEEIPPYQWKAFSMQKQVLGRALCEFFEIDENPFEPLQERKGVRTSPNLGFHCLFKVRTKEM
jgi:hypothetical protein